MTLKVKQVYVADKLVEALSLKVIFWTSNGNFLSLQTFGF